MTIKPALSSEEWTKLGFDRVATRAELFSGVLTIRELDDSEYGDSLVTLTSGHLHALAALALHGQPEGFTWDDVDAIRTEVADEWTTTNGVLEPGKRLLLIADRIEALLPPRESGER